MFPGHFATQVWRRGWLDRQPNHVPLAGCFVT